MTPVTHVDEKQHFFFPPVCVFKRFIHQDLSDTLNDFTVSTQRPQVAPKVPTFTLIQAEFVFALLEIIRNYLYLINLHQWI